MHFIRQREILNVKIRDKRKVQNDASKKFYQTDAGSRSDRIFNPLSWAKFERRAITHCRFPRILDFGYYKNSHPFIEFVK
jgi:hypothetical protein